MKTIDFSFDNVGGISHMYAIEPSSIASILISPVTSLAQITLIADANVVELPVYAPTATDFTEEQSITDAGENYAVSISGLIPRQNNQIVVSELERGEWVVAHQDCNGDVLLSGTIDVPLAFASRKTTGSDGSTRNGIAFTFSGNEPLPSLHLDPSSFSIS